MSRETIRCLVDIGLFWYVVEHPKLLVESECASSLHSDGLPSDLLTDLYTITDVIAFDTDRFWYLFAPNIIDSILTALEN